MAHSREDVKQILKMLDTKNVGLISKEAFVQLVGKLINPTWEDRHFNELFEAARATSGDFLMYDQFIDWIYGGVTPEANLTSDMRQQAEAIVKQREVDWLNSLSSSIRPLIVDSLTDSASFKGWGGVLRSIAIGAVVPIRGSYLVQLRRSGQLLCRGQELPLQAAWSYDELVSILVQLVEMFGPETHQDPAGEWVAGGIERFGGMMVALSPNKCPAALSADHPDPKGHALEYIAEFIEGYFSKDTGLFDDSCASTTLYSRVFKPLGIPDKLDLVFFWDYASLAQKPRSALEEVLFREGLKACNFWFGHQYIPILIQPPDQEISASRVERQMSNGCEGQSSKGKLSPSSATASRFGTNELGRNDGRRFMSNASNASRTSHMPPVQNCNWCLYLRPSPANHSVVLDRQHVGSRTTTSDSSVKKA